MAGSAEPAASGAQPRTQLSQPAVSSSALPPGPGSHAAADSGSAALAGHLSTGAVARAQSHSAAVLSMDTLTSAVLEPGAQARPDMLYRCGAGSALLWLHATAWALAAARVSSSCVRPPVVPTAMQCGCAVHGASTQMLSSAAASSAPGQTCALGRRTSHATMDLPEAAHRTCGLHHCTQADSGASHAACATGACRSGSHSVKPLAPAWPTPTSALPGAACTDVAGPAGSW